MNRLAIPVHCQVGRRGRDMVEHALCKQFSLDLIFQGECRDLTWLGQRLGTLHLHYLHLKIVSRTQCTSLSITML